MNSCSDSDIDIEVINRVRNGSPVDFRILVDRYSDRIYRFLYAKSINRNDLDDILQETFLKAYLNISKYNESYSFSTWLYTIAYHEMCRFYLKKKNQREENQIDFIALPNNNDKTTLGIWEEASQLNAGFYTVLWLKYHEELEVKEIAVIMKSSVAMVKINLFRARNQLKKILLSEKNKSEKKKTQTITLSHNSI